MGFIPDIHRILEKIFIVLCYARIYSKWYFYVEIFMETYFKTKNVFDK